MRQKQPARATFAREVSVATEMTSDPESISGGPFAGAPVAMGTPVARILGLEQLVSKGQGSGSYSALFLPWLWGHGCPVDPRGGELLHLRMTAQAGNLGPSPQVAASACSSPRLLYRECAAERSWAVSSVCKPETGSLFWIPILGSVFPSLMGDLHIFLKFYVLQSRVQSEWF